MTDVIDFPSAPRAPELIETPSYLDMRHILEDCYASARLAVIRGGYGVGKTFALKRFAAEHEYDVAYLALDPTTRALTPGLSATCLAVEVTWAANYNREPRGQTRNSSYPRAIKGALERCLLDYKIEGCLFLLIVDEAQHADPHLLDAFRHLYDHGLCGLVVAGNSNLFNPRRGRIETADFGALIRRARHSFDIPRPTPGDIAAVLDTYRIAGPEARAFLSGCAEAGGGLEFIAGIEKARELCGSPVPGLKYLKAAMATTGLSGMGWRRTDR